VFRTTVLIVCALTLTSIASAEEYNLNPGMWETTSKMEFTGVPPEMAAMMQQPPEIEKECVKDRNYEFNPGDNAQGCEVKSTRHSDKKASWDIVCNHEGGKSTGHGEVNFEGDKMHGFSDMEMSAGPMGPMKMHHTFESKRVGSC